MHRKLKKRGDSAIISWVLLIGLAIATATTIFFWLQGQTEKYTEETTKFVEGDISCKEISLNAILDENCENLKIINKGMLNIDKVKIRIYKNDDSVNIIEDGLIPPKQSIDVDIGTNNNRTEIIPLINVTSTFAICNERILTVKC